MKALLLSAYAADSHRYWACGLMAHLDAIDWTAIELAPRHFQWRVRGNPLSFMSEHDETLSHSFDLIVATSLVDLATLIGLYPHLGRAWRVVYFHENQFAYPLGPQQTRRIEPLMVNLYSALAADRVLFNSQWNQDSFFEGVDGFLKKMPERVTPVRLETLKAHSEILPVPLWPLEEVPSAGQGAPARIVWNHRWEYDKNPEDFFAALETLSDKGLEFELVVMGQVFRKTPEVFEQARARLARHITCWGHQTRARYLEALGRGGIVVSSAWHEFQGLAVMEAVQHGCVPLVPERLCFPEYYAPEYRYDGSREALITRLAQWLTAPDTRPNPPDLGVWTWPQMAERYRRSLDGSPGAGAD
ncbi:tRNA-queuosine alpha-mannosyltransferase domain-containing protein [Kushneria indalinina]|uniref:tRNA-queuosine alpha-mannosyltransferase n=1 Tax=Kushneria indalinina DSM 14324 TaxID=1122140 RepID=A0A3D9DXT4_9GAMM|nr:DUF3524 domain-containing protein [Kushneria indalinina]REC95465.1 uncharacterized protein DUF3524 [Kushneria indalinina DSM 14324]